MLQLGCSVLLAALVTNQLGLWTRLGVIAGIGQVAMSSMALVMVAWLCRGWRRLPAVLGMLGCLAGDLAPRLVGGDAAPLAMIGAFALGQVFLVVAFWKSVDWHAGTTQTLALLLTGYAVALFTYLVFAAEGARGLLLPMAGYAVLLVVMALSASGSRWGLVGGLLFVVSDSLLAMRLLGVIADSVPISSVLMACYGLALLCLTVALVHLSRTRTRPQPTWAMTQPW